MFNKVVTDYYKRQVLQQQGGGGGRVYRGSPYMRGTHVGSGLGTILSSALKAAIPIAKTAGRYLAKKGVKELAGFAGDMISGDSPKMAAQKRASRFLEDMKIDSQRKIARLMNDSTPLRPRVKRRHTANKNRRKTKTKTDNIGSFR